MQPDVSIQQQRSLRCVRTISTLQFLNNMENPYTRLDQAAACGDFARALAALADGAVVVLAPDTEYGETVAPIVSAVRAGHRAMVAHFLSRGANPNDGVDAVHPQRADMLQLLLDAGADVNRYLGPVIRQREFAPAPECLAVMVAHPGLNLGPVPEPESWWQPRSKHSKTLEEVLLACGPPRVEEAAMVAKEVRLADTNVHVTWILQLRSYSWHSSS